MIDGGAVIFWGLTTAIAWTDLRRQVIPNGFVLAGVANAGLNLLWTHAWWHLAWAGGTWLAYEGWLAGFPGTLGWGDVKWATVTMLTLGSTGLTVVLAGHLGAVLWGTVRWGWRRGCRGLQEPWRGQPIPWAPGAWVGLTGVLVIFVWMVMAR